MLKLNINTSHVTVFFVSVCGAVLQWEGLHTHDHHNMYHDIVNTSHGHMIPGGGTGAAVYSGGCGGTNEGR